MVVSHTHWDREWYLPYQSFRVRLVGLFDDLLELFDSDPDYKHFMLDGHTIPLEDYLEVRPDRFDDVERVVQQGKLLIGPWYIIPDEALPGGEALVRNFLRGHRVAKMFGPVMKVGYIPDPFGQIAHMPAILRGFGIERATMWRGTDDSLKTTEFFWRSPDGSEVLTVHKPHGYGNAATLPRSKNALLSRIGQARDALEPLATTPYLLLMNGSDHLGAAGGAVVDAARRRTREMHDAVAEHASLPELFDRIEEYMGDRAGEWPRHEGEFRSGQRAHLLPGVLSARMWIKQSNQECEDLLAHWAEPFSTWSDILQEAGRAGVEGAAAADDGAHAVPDVGGVDRGADRPRVAAPAREPAARLDLRLLGRRRARGDAPALRVGARDRRGDRAAVAAHDRRAGPGLAARHDRRLQPDAAAGDGLRDGDGAVERRAPDRGGDRAGRRARRRRAASARRSSS